MEPPSRNNEASVGRTVRDRLNEASFSSGVPIRELTDMFGAGYEIVPGKGGYLRFDDYLILSPNEVGYSGVGFPMVVVRPRRTGKAAQFVAMDGDVRSVSDFGTFDEPVLVIRNRRELESFKRLLAQSGSRGFYDGDPGTNATLRIETKRFPGERDSRVYDVRKKGAMDAHREAQRKKMEFVMKERGKRWVLTAHQMNEPYYYGEAANRRNEVVGYRTFKLVKR